MISLSRAVGCFADILRRQVNMDEEGGWYGEALDERVRDGGGKVPECGDSVGRLTT